MKTKRTIAKLPPLKLNKILVPTDFSETAGNALRHAINIAKAGKAKIKLIHVVTPVYVTSPDTMISWGDSFYKSMVKKTNVELKKIADNVKKTSSIDIEYTVKMGAISDEICAIAKKEKFDLIVMGTHGVSGVKEFFAGSNAYKVVRHSICSVLTVQKKSSAKGFTNIILPIRLERSSRQKVDYAVKMAQLFDATILVVGFTNEKDKNTQSKVKQYVAQVERYLSENNVKHKSTSIFANHFTTDILAFAKKNKADLIVVMKEHDFSLDQLIKGHYAEQFVNHSSVPVLSIPVTHDSDMLVYTPYLSGSTPF